MALQLGETAPDFEADTTHGRIRFHDWLGDSWGVLFSHPKDFTPVCTTELGYMARIKPEFDRRNVKIIGLSVDPVDNHARWADDIRDTQGHAPNYPMIGDTDLSISKAWGMLPASTTGDASKRTPVDTHLHADHITGLGALRDRTHCITVMGEQSGVDVVSMRVTEGDKVEIEGVALDVLYTPGHTDDSYSFLLPDRVFTGDTLLIRGTGRTDFQNGDPRAQYQSIFGKLLKLPDSTFVFPAHDYKGDTVSTIGEEKAFNPRLQVRSVDEYVDLMSNLHLPNPKMMDVAVPANMHIGMVQEEIARRGWAVSPADALALLDRHDVVLVDLREPREREKHGLIPGS